MEHVILTYRTDADAIRFYVASGLENRDSAKIVIEELESQGWKCTYNWTIHGAAYNRGKEFCREIASNEVNGVCDADVVIVILPGGRGTHGELVGALCCGTPVVIYSEKQLECDSTTCAFYWHPLVHRTTNRNLYGEVLVLLEQIGFTRKFQQEVDVYEGR